MDKNSNSKRSIFVIVFLVSTVYIKALFEDRVRHINWNINNYFSQNIENDNCTTKDTLLQQYKLSNKKINL